MLAISQQSRLPRIKISLSRTFPCCFEQTAQSPLKISCGADISTQECSHQGPLGGDSTELENDHAVLGSQTWDISRYFAVDSSSLVLRKLLGYSPSSSSLKARNDI